MPVYSANPILKREKSARLAWRQQKGVREQARTPLKCSLNAGETALVAQAALLGLLADDLPEGTRAKAQVEELDPDPHEQNQ